MRFLPCLAILLLAAGCAAPAAPAPEAAPDPDALDVVAFRVEANETRIDRSGTFGFGWCNQSDGCGLSPLLDVGWHPWSAERRDRGLFWRANATFAWTDGVEWEARVAVHLLVPATCSQANETAARAGPAGAEETCLRAELLQEVQGKPPLRLAVESFDGRIEGVRLSVIPLDIGPGQYPVVDPPEGRWSGVIQAFHRAPGAEDIELA